MLWSILITNLIVIILAILYFYFGIKFIATLLPKKKYTWFVAFILSIWMPIVFVIIFILYLIFGKK